MKRSPIVFVSVFAFAVSQCAAQNADTMSSRCNRNPKLSGQRLRLGS